MGNEDFRASLEDCVTFHSRDWSTDKRDAWIYGIVCGWDNESLKELSGLHGWTRATVARLQRLHEAFSMCARNEDEARGQGSLFQMVGTSRYRLSSGYAPPAEKRKDEGEFSRRCAVTEEQRLAFIEDRDGPKAAAAFAARTFMLYGAALRTPYGKAYRRELVTSRVVFRAYLRRAQGSDER